MNWAPVTRGNAQTIADRLRHSDRFEVARSHDWSHQEAVDKSVKFSTVLRCICADNGEPVGLCGVTRRGCIWLLATDGLLATASSRRQFARESRAWVEGLVQSQLFPLLENWVLAQNTGTLRWLRWLGFTIDPAEPMGCGQFLFCRAWRKAQW